MKAMIFAAGFGKRLQPLTLNTPKALIKVKGRPLLDWVIDRLIQCGVTELIINTHYLHSAVQHHIQSLADSIRISISYEETILGTGSGLYKTRHFWDKSDFLVHNVDILCNADLTELLSFHRSQESYATLAVNRQSSASMLLADDENRLVGRSLEGSWQLMRKACGNIREVGFCGIQSVSPDIFGRVRPPMSFSIIDDYMFLLNRNVKIMTWSIGSAYWADIGTVSALEQAEKAFPG